MFKFKDVNNLCVDNEVYIKREDCIHSFVSGNKYRKLKYNLQEAENQEKKTLLTFGGAYSNHVTAVATVGAEFGFKTIGVIRGEELKSSKKLNPTLSLAKLKGMHFKFVSREIYRQKNEIQFIANLKQEVWRLLFNPRRWYKYFGSKRL